MLVNKTRFLNLVRSLSIKMSVAKKGKKRVNVAYESEPLSSSTDAAALSKNVKFEPKNWDQVLQNIRQMRKENVAPVDTMGCEKCFDDDIDEKTKRFQILVSLMLSSQTKDETTFAACQKLKTIGFSPQSLAKAEVSQVEKLLNPVSFYKTKAKHIKLASQTLLNDYDGDIPNTVESLIKLPGVGPKMAHICMNAAWNIVSGIGIDIHCHRIANRLQWVSKPTKTPEQTRIELESWLPFKLWSEVNLLLVGFGQTICAAKSPKCSECLNQKICPSAFKECSPKGKKKK